jgi:3-oxoisoapionate decarboxylase
MIRPKKGNMKDKLGLSSYAYYWAIKGTGSNKVSPWSAWDLLDRAATLDLEVLQICENLPLLGWDKSDLEQFGEAARQQDVVLEVGARGLDLDSLYASMEVARTLGTCILRITPWSGLETRRQFPLDRLHEAVHQLLPVCREYDITLAIENYFDLPDQELASFVRQVNDVHVGVCLDTANSVGLLEKPLETAELLAPFVASVHLKDFVVRKPVMGYVVSGVPLGQGWLDAQGVLNLVRCAGRQPNVLLELWMDPAENHEATLRREDEWVRQSLAYARGHLGLGPVHEQDIYKHMEVTE